MALVQVVLSDLVSPRERGRYMGYLGAVMGVGTVGGPLLGGVITDRLGWRWSFFVGVPIAVAAFIVLQKTLHLPARAERKVTDRLPRRDADLRGRLGAADLGLVRRPPVRLGLVADRRDGRSAASRCWSPRSRVERRAARADDPAAAVREPHARARRDRQHRGRRRDVRHLGVPQPVHADRPRQDADASPAC